MLLTGRNWVDTTRDIQENHVIMTWCRIPQSHEAQELFFKSLAKRSQNVFEMTLLFGGNFHTCLKHYDSST